MLLEMKITLTLLGLIYGIWADKIRIPINISKDCSRVTASASGESEQVISDDELRAFGITAKAVNDAVWELSNTKPDAVYTKDSQSAWGKLYKNNGWEEVTREIDPEKAVVLNVQQKPCVIATEKITNNNSFVSTIDAKLLDSLPDTISTSWGKYGGINDSKTLLEYKINFEDTGSNLYFSLPWGQDAQNSKPDTNNGNSERYPISLIQLAPQETVTAELVGTEVVVDLVVKYDVDFDGDVICYYANGYNGKNFEEFDIETILETGNLPRDIRVKESVQLVVYTNVKLVVKRNNSSES